MATSAVHLATHMRSHSPRIISDVLPILKSALARHFAFTGHVCFAINQARITFTYLQSLDNTESYFEYMLITPNRLPIFPVFLQHLIAPITPKVSKTPNSKTISFMLLCIFLCLNVIKPNSNLLGDRDLFEF